MADWLCPHTPNICDYAEQCATKLAAEVASLKNSSSKFVQVRSGGWSQVIAVDMISRIYKDTSYSRGEETTVQLKDGTKIVVEESIKTIQCRIGCELMP